MKRFFLTDRDNWTTLVARLSLGFVVFPHGAQKLFGWFDGNGFEATMNGLTNHMHIPYFIALLVILIESIGSICLIIGLATRFFAFAMLANFIGIILHSHINNGFFMNWSMLPDKPEGFEFHLLILGMCIVLLIAGGGKWSVDSVLHPRHRVSEGRQTSVVL